MRARPANLLRDAGTRGLHEVTVIGGRLVAIDREGHLYLFSERSCRWVELEPRCHTGVRRGTEAPARQPASKPPPHSSASH